MRTPDRCPWCGADHTEGEPIQYWGDEDYRCGAVMVDGEWLCTCPDHDTPAAAAYRETMAWRKRLSQHTGVPLRMVGEPIRIDSSPTWRGGIWFESLGGRWRLQCWDRADLGQMSLTIRERASRRLLVKEA